MIYRQLFMCECFHYLLRVTLFLDICVIYCIVYCTLVSFVVLVCIYWTFPSFIIFDFCGINCSFGGWKTKWDLTLFTIEKHRDKCIVYHNGKKTCRNKWFSIEVRVQGYCLYASRKQQYERKANTMSSQTAVTVL